MALVRDLALVDQATRIPALQDLVREAVIKAIFVRDERALPREVVATLNRSHDVVIKPADLVEVKKIVAVANRSESTTSLGLPSEEYHHFRRKLSIALDERVGLSWKPSLLATYDWMVPPQGGILLDPSELDGVEIDDRMLRGLAGTGAKWKAVYDAALAKDRLLPFYPVVPMDFAVGDALIGDAPFASFDGPFEDWVYGVRAINSQGHAVWVGFANVPNHTSGYDLRGLALQACPDLFAPIGVSFPLRGRPAVLKNLRVGFEDAGALATVLERLVASVRPFSYVSVYDDRAAAHLRPGDAAPPFALELGYGGTEALVAAREKAFEKLLEGSTGTEDLPSLYEESPETCQERSERLASLVFVGEVRVPLGAIGKAVTELRSFGEGKGFKVGLLGAASRRGYASLWPFFETTKEPPRIYDLSKGVWDVARTLPDGVLISRLAHHFNRDRHYRRRVELLYKLNAAIDQADVMEPPEKLGR
jgi:hypothetical protein